MAPATIKDLASELKLSDTYLAPLTDPPLTTVEQPSCEIGKTAAQLLMAQINSTDEHFVSKFIVYKYPVNRREFDLKGGDLSLAEPISAYPNK